MKKLLFSILLFLPFTFLAQEKELQNIFSVELRNKGTIVSDSKVTGYYLFYKTDEVKKGVFDYELLILDQNLNQLVTKQIEGSDHLILNDCSYNEKELFIELIDLKKEKSISKRYNQATQEIESNTDKLSQFEMMKISAQKASENNIKPESIYPVNKYGFLKFKSKMDGRKMKPVVQFISSIDNKKNWTYEYSGKQKKDMVSAGHLYADKNIVLGFVWKSDLVTAKRMGKKTDTYVLGINTQNGKELFETKLDTDEYNYQTRSAHYDISSNKTHLYGVYTSSKDGIISGDGSLGLFSITVDKKGKVIQRNHISWTEQINVQLENEINKLSEEQKAQVHAVHRLNTGKTYIIVEQAKINKKQFETGDFLLIELNEENKLSNVQVIEKEINKGSIDIRENSVSRTLKKNNNLVMATMYSIGAWSYRSSYTNARNDEITILYTSSTEEDNENSLLIGSIVIGSKEPEISEIKLSNVTDLKYLDLMRAKSGNVCVFQYFEDKKSIKWTLEKIQ